MSYGPIWYEWSKRPMVESDCVHGDAPYTHTRHGVGKGTVTELYWCQPGLYRGAPGFTRTKYRELRATIVVPTFYTNDEYTNRVHVTCTDFVCAFALAKAIEYANSTETEPGSDSPNLAACVEYVPGQDYPCEWCGRTAVKVCKGYYDPGCVNKNGDQHHVYSTMREFDKKCHAERFDKLYRKDGTQETIPFSKHCYRGRGHEGEHGSGCGLDGWNTEIYPVQERGEWVGPTEEELAQQRPKLLEKCLATVEKCRAGLMDGHGNPTSNTLTAETCTLE